MCAHRAWQLAGESNYFLLRHAFEGAVDEARRRASANYTFAVPQHYNGKVQLLLPLRLTSDQAELALTIERLAGITLRGPAWTWRWLIATHVSSASLRHPGFARRRVRE